MGESLDRNGVVAYIQAYESPDGKPVDSMAIATALKASNADVIGILLSLTSLPAIQISKKSIAQWSLSKEGGVYAKSGSPEFAVLSAIPDEGIAQAAINASLGKAAGRAVGTCQKEKWIAREGKGAETRLVRTASAPTEDVTQQALLSLDTQDTKALEKLKKRKLVEKKTVSIYEVTPLEGKADFGYLYELVNRKLETTLTADMLRSGDWEKAAFKPLNMAPDAGKYPTAGALHPLNEFKAQYRYRIYLI
ncbi:hypothetical protein KIPB_007928 [Kipferlia bialata]|uniref:PheRS DNA binding domain-containing protein n=1 Tax=Kipferlia bialata TaxID=797122 RepID=A0A391P454_9EUKA|nr:hypothetical protein KIPB_007928 [Kipferlia bialata]|eukprot:g7928.t1